MDDGVKPAAKRNGTPRTIVRKGRSPFRGLNCLFEESTRSVWFRIYKY
jgi:hypothetical protein